VAFFIHLYWFIYLYGGNKGYSMTRYQHLASLLAERIEQGLYRDGEKLPSVRSLSQEHGVSISTVQQAYQMLEQQRLITPQPRSGYFVAPRKAQPPVPPMSRPVQRPVEITQWDQVLTMLDARNDKSIIPFGGGSPDVTQPSLKPLWRELSRVIQHNINEVLNYDELAGRRELREQIARLMLDGGSVVTVDDLVITSGCHSALSLALLSVCQPGDIVAVESPTYYGTMQLLRGLGLKAIEIPTDPDSGISLEALELALDQWPIKGVILVPNCNNPQGFIMPDARKRAILTLAQRHDIVIFEDDIYGELATDYPRPRTIHSWDIDGRVMLCSSFTKTIAPGLRIGWIAPGRYYDRLLQMKYAASGTNVPRRNWRHPFLFAKATTTDTCGGCGRSTSAIWKSIPAGCGSIFRVGSASPGQKAAICCGLSYRSMSIWSASRSNCAA
jgi:DNA-binding transcriptional MocR family regulator